MEKSRCKGCGAEIIWCRSPNGKRMPVDAKPITAFVLNPEMDGFEPDFQSPPTSETVKAHLSHFATCPKADRFRR